MCDTLITFKPTSSIQVLFGKNSDREPNEAQAILRYPQQTWAPGVKLPCTYITIPQVHHTHTIIVSKPFHMWGAEMGVNEHGVMAGNEAIFSRVKLPGKNTGLTGMDLLRLGLERAVSADNCLEVITDLLSAYGQDACGGYKNKTFFYHNSFIIADPHKAWVLETIDREWVAREVQGADTISNGLTITDDYTLCSKNLFTLARAKGWDQSVIPQSFRDTYTDRLYTHFSACKVRQQLTAEAVQSPALADADIMHILSHHDAGFHPSRATASEVCMHATSMLNPSQTTGSMVVHWPREGAPVVWLTGTSTPCLSVYKPFFLDSDMLNLEDWNNPGHVLDQTLWWQAEQIHRYINRHYAQWSGEYLTTKNVLQDAFLKASATVRFLSPSERHHWSEHCLKDYQEFLQKWHTKLSSRKPHPEGHLWFRWYQKQQNKAVGIN